MNKRLLKLFDEVKSAFRSPTLKQKEAYGRFFHTMSAACCIGAVSLGFSYPPTTTHTGVKVVALVLWAVVLFLIGSVLSKGE